MKTSRKLRVFAFVLAAVMVISQFSGSLLSAVASDHEDDTVEIQETLISEMSKEQYQELQDMAQKEYGKFIQYKDDAEKKYAGCDWYESASLKGLYAAKGIRDYIGKSYLGEDLTEILLMAEDKKHLPDFNLEEFFKGTVMEGMTREDLQKRYEKGKSLDAYIAKKSDEPVRARDKKTFLERFALEADAATQTGTLNLRSTQYRGSYSITYEDRKGRERTLSHNGSVFQMTMTTGGKKYPAFCISIGKSANSGTTYSSCSAEDVSIGKNGILALKRAAYYYESIKKQTDRAWVIAQVYVWACANAGADPDDSGIIYSVARQLGKTAEQAKVTQNYFENTVFETIKDEDSDVVKLTYWKNESAARQNFATYNLLEENPKTGSLWVMKTDIVNGDLIEGVTFNIYSDKDCKNKVTSMTTDKNGEAYSVDLEVGTYYVKEVAKTALEGFVADTKAYKVEIKADEETVIENEAESYEFQNRGWRADVEISKTDYDTGKPLDGVIFCLYQYNAQEKKYEEWEYFTQDDDEVYRASTLEYGIRNEGKFMVEELEARPGYVGDYDADGKKKTYQFQLDEDKDGKTYVLTNDGFVEKSKVSADKKNFTNKSIKGEIKVIKTDEDAGAYVSSHGDASLDGTEFSLYAKADIVHPDGKTGVLYKAGSLVKSGKLKGNQLTFKDLYLGSYTVKETAATDGYLLDGTGTDIELTAEKDTDTVVARDTTRGNQVKKQPFQLIKMSTGGGKD